MGWESPDEWAFENETLVTRSAKLKCNRLVPDPQSAVVETPKTSKAKTCKDAASTPSSSTRRSARGKDSAAENMVQRAMRRAAAKDDLGMSPSPPLAHFLPLSLLLLIRICFRLRLIAV